MAIQRDETGVAGAGHSAPIAHPAGGPFPTAAPAGGVDTTTEISDLIGDVIAWHCQPHPHAPGRWALWCFHSGRPVAQGLAFPDVAGALEFARAFALPGDSMIVIYDDRAPRLVAVVPA